MNPRLLPIWALALAAACSHDTPAAPAPADDRTESAASCAADELDRIDTRAPVPLLPMMADHQKQNMRDHLLAVQEIVAALAIDDYPAIERAAGRIGYSDHMGQMCTHMGAGAPGFTEAAIEFHRTADGISAAARDADRQRVLTELSATLETCTSCHAAWRQQVVDQSQWQALTSSPHPGGGHAAP